MTSRSLLSYYREHEFNPVPIAVENADVWQSHLAKRCNLYERHLGIPLRLMRDRAVLEFGCNSGENALVLANFGADLTLVEPNEQVMPRLKALFKQFGFEKRIEGLVQEGIDTFQASRLYDVVIAEGFINHLANRDRGVKKIISLVAPGGLAVMSFDCRYGHFLEMTRKFIFGQACRLAEIEDVHSIDSLELAKQLYVEDFRRLNASRPFEVWWKDVLVNPFVAWKYLWSYQELIPIVEEAGGEILSSSPKWSSIDSFTWHKNVLDTASRHRRLLDEWYGVFSFFLTGLWSSHGDIEPASTEVVNSVSSVVREISDYTTAPSPSKNSVLYPSLLDEYFEKSNDSRLRRFNSEIKGLYEAARSCRLEDLISAYWESKCVRNLWGAPYHYVSFRKLT